MEKHFINYKAATLFWLLSWDYGSHFTSFQIMKKTNIPNKEDYLVNEPP